ncbi:MAG: DUF6034 family protein [Burkholderiales bacterium]
MRNTKLAALCALIAISKADEKLYDGKPSPAAESGGGYHLYLKCYMGKDKAAWLTLDQSINGTSTQMLFENSDYNCGYRWRVSPEVFIVIIDHEGIKTVCRLNHTEYIETVAEDMPLLDFNTEKGIFENYCKYRFSWAPPYDDMPKDMGATFNVKRVELNLMVIPEKDNLENYITVPVWDLIADQEYEEGLTDQEGNPFEGRKDISILTINAVNGTIINREQGY